MQKLLLAMVVCMAFSGPLKAQTAIPADIPAPDAIGQARAALAGFDAEVEKIRSDWKVQGVAIAIVKGDQLIYAKGFGQRDAARALPMTADTLLPIGSTTKAFTSAVLASLVEEGKLDWEKPVRTWLPDFKLQDALATERMTPLDLVTHRSGMPRHDLLWFNSGWSRAEMVRRLQYLEPNKDFRTDFQYNNTMVITAGYLEEVVTGKSWEDNVRERLFLPLGMKRANFSLDQTRQDADFSQPYRRDNDGTVQAMAFAPDPGAGPAGSIIASVNELAAWLQMHLDHGKYHGRQVLSPASTDFLHVPRIVLEPQSTPDVVPVGYAPGWFSDVYRGQFRLHHGGNVAGFSVQLTMLPRAGIGIVVLTNMNNTPTPDLLTRTAMDRLLGLERRSWSDDELKRQATGQQVQGPAELRKVSSHKSGTHPSHPLADYAGEYEHPGYGTLTVRHADGKLTFAFNGPAAPLPHWHYDTFDASKGDNPYFKVMKIQFNSGFDGEIDALQLAMEERVKPAVFVKRADARLSEPRFLAHLVGSYALSPDDSASVRLQANKLMLELPGDAPYALVPVRGVGTRFALASLPGFFVDFKLGQTGEATAFDLDQPNAIFTASRKP
jgi:CubicO group peptidase (beta-lactamase class C family)